MFALPAIKASAIVRSDCIYAGATVFTRTVETFISVWNKGIFKQKWEIITFSCFYFYLAKFYSPLFVTGNGILLCIWPCETYEPRHDKTNKMSVRPAKTQISLGIQPVWSESSLCAQWVAKDPSFLHADREDSDQTGRMPRLTRVFAGRTLILLVLSCHGSIIVYIIFCMFSIYINMPNKTL